MISVIIPAHNEGSVILRTLHSITDGAAANELDVIVVCNGCTDDTASAARSFRPAVRVLETSVAGKTNALNMGDQAAQAFPRIYLDADVVVTVQTLRKLAQRLDSGDVLAVAPKAQFDLTGCSWPVRAFYSIRARLPSAQEGIGGSGVYALSEGGRKRFGEYPAVIADDGFVRVQFQPQERETLTGVTSTVFPPRTLHALTAVRTRAHYGSLELARRHPELWNRRGRSNSGSLFRLFADPRLWIKLAIYCFVTLTSRRRAARSLERGRLQWHHDSSSRMPA